MSRLPIPHFIQEIKTKLGFDRAMTAPGDDVVDAVNKNSDKISDLGPVNALNNNNTTKALSAAMGKYLGDNCLHYKGNVPGSMNDWTDTGIYYGAGVSDCPPGTDGYGGFAVFNVAYAGDKASTAQFYWGYNLTRPYFRQYNHAVQAWTSWELL